MEISERKYWILVVTGMVCVISGVIGYFGLPQSFSDFVKFTGWMSAVLGIVSLTIFFFVICKYEYLAAELLTIGMVCIIMAPFLIYYQEGAENRKMKNECSISGGEWAYLGEKEGYGCRKEYESCGPDENRPGFTICEKKFKRID